MVKQVFRQSYRWMIYLPIVSVTLLWLLNNRLPGFLFLWLMLFLLLPLFFTIHKMASKVEVKDGMLWRRNALRKMKVDLTQVEIIVLEQKIINPLIQEIRPKRIDLQGVVSVGRHEVISLLYSYPLIQPKDQERFQQAVLAVNPKIEFINEKLTLQDLVRFM